MSIKTFFVVATLAASVSAIEFASAQDFPTGRHQASDETRGQGRHGRSRRHGATAESIIERADTNGDGVLDEAEFADSKLNNVEERFQRRDADSDGFLSREETEGSRRGVNLDVDVTVLQDCIIESGGNPEIDADRFALADLNDDGLISFDEFVISIEEQAYAQFARIDSNLDGYITVEEIEDSVQAKKDHRALVKACMEESADPLF